MIHDTHYWALWGRRHEGREVPGDTLQPWHRQGSLAADGLRDVSSDCLPLSSLEVLLLSALALFGGGHSWAHVGMSHVAYHG